MAAVQTVMTKERSDLGHFCLRCELNPTLLQSYLEITFDELRCFDSRLHVEADVHLDPGLMVSELDDGHLRGGGVNTGARGLNALVCGRRAGAAQAYCCFVQDFDGMWAGHVVFVQGLLQLLQRGVVPLSKHHQVNVTMAKK